MLLLPNTITSIIKVEFDGEGYVWILLSIFTDTGNIQSGLKTINTDSRPTSFIYVCGQ